MMARGKKTDCAQGAKAIEMKTTTVDFKKCLAGVRRGAEMGHVGRALAALEKMLKTWPDHSTLLVEKSRLIQLSKHGELTEAKRALQRATEVDDAAPNPWIELGFYRLSIDDVAEDAEEKFDHAIDLGLRLLAEAVTGKIDAVLDQAVDYLPASRSAEMEDPHQLAQFLSRRHGKNAPWEIQKLRERIAETRATDARRQKIGTQWHVTRSTQSINQLRIAMTRFALLASLLILGLLSAAPHAGEKKKPLRVCFISGSTEYESDKTLPILKKYFESKHPSMCTLVSAKSQKDLPGLENLDKCDVAVLFTRRLELQGDQLERIKKYCTSGKPLVGIRTASHGIQTWLELDKEVFGGNYMNHYKEGPLCQVQQAPGKILRPLLEGVKPFESKGSLYKNTGHAKDINVLLTGTIPDHTEPIAWTRTYKGGRIFYTSLGHQKDFEEESFLRLMSNAIVWAAGRDK
jgi:type 1 glutamine amidotransferase